MRFDLFYGTTDFNPHGSSDPASGDYRVAMLFGTLRICGSALSFCIRCKDIVSVRVVCTINTDGFRMGPGEGLDQCSEARHFILDRGGQRFRIISAREATGHEREQYEKRQ